jgi:tRNA threonylcarbamoyladenosine biosynthesis protein TsaE
LLAGSRYYTEHMNIAMTWQIESLSLAETLKIGATIGQKLRGGEVIELTSDLGGGKTSFIRGIAAGMGSDDKVHSPSFTLTNEYRANRLTLFHFDLYRLSQAGIISDELAEILNDRTAVVAIEWSRLVENILPDERLSIRIKVTGQNSRKFIFNCPQNLAYLKGD